jgi:sialate O-acetylesterase
MTLRRLCCVVLIMLAVMNRGAMGAGDAPATAAAPSIQLGAPFCDNAVLQRDMEIPVWGWSKPGTEVTVSFAGQTKKAKAGKDGKWMLALDKLKASFEPAEMVIQESGGRGQGSGKRVVLKNILVGEVWMASGQSNMQWKVAKSSARELEVAAVGAGQVAPIREFEITSVYAMLHPIEKATGAWKNGSYTDYSAIAFAFAENLYRELNVPIGILNCSFSQTAIQAWVPREGFRDGDDDYTKAIYQKVLQTDPTTPEHKTAWNAFYTSLQDQIKENDARIKRGEAPLPVAGKPPGNMSGNRDATWLFHGRLNAVIPYAIRGGIWNQGYANMGEGLPYYNNLHSMIRGWRMEWDRPELPVYFHQFYSAAMKHAGKEDNSPSIGPTPEMRLGTWMARDIPNSGMASQIDITGAIHYGSKTVPGQRLALHALKNQYGKKVVVDGPMFSSYKVKGDKLIVTFDNAKGGLVVAETGYNAVGRKDDSTGFANPKIIANGDGQVKLFYLAGADRVWHPASVTIDGDKAVVSSLAVKKPHGVSYATAGVGFQPNLYNKALLPMTPFIYFDNEMVTSEMWPTEKLKIAGAVIDPNTIGKKYAYRKMPLLAPQFRDNAVLQAGKPVTVWGSAIHDWGYEAEGEAVIEFSFAGLKKTIPVTAGMKEWKVVVPAAKASAEPKTLKVTFKIDGELVHERGATNVVYGDVWYIAAPAMKMNVPAVKDSGKIVRMITNQSKRSTKSTPSRFSVCVSTTPGNRFAAYWKDASGLAAAYGHSIAAKTGNPVGIIFMKNKPSKGGTDPVLNSWIAPAFLDQAPSLLEHYKSVGSQYPGNPYYNANVESYIAAWKTYWSDYIPEMIATKAVPDGAKWGNYPSRTASAGDSKATQTYNVTVHSFSPTALKGVIFLTSDVQGADDQAANFGPEMSALANCFKAKFGDADAEFIYTIPGKALARKITAPKAIKGKSTAIEIGDWADLSGLISGQ